MCNKCRHMKLHAAHGTEIGLGGFYIRIVLFFFFLPFRKKLMGNQSLKNFTQSGSLWVRQRA